MTEGRGKGDVVNGRVERRRGGKFRCNCFGGGMKSLTVDRENKENQPQAAGRKEGNLFTKRLGAPAFEKKVTG